MGARIKLQRGNQQGQVSLLIAMMMATFILFFAFVINVGMLVNAKINLQNAADLAAYAGAAVQARQLNDISYINYDMRRAYKKFLFRYYVVGNMFAKSHPTDTGDMGTARSWFADPNLGDLPEGNLPGVCIAFNPNFNNYCQKPDLGSISIPPMSSGGLDQINDTLNQTLTNIEKERQANCAVIGTTNKALLRLWLWNFDPDLTKMQQQVDAAADEKFKAAFGTVKGLAYGLGLLPKLFIHRMRIETLKNYVNHKPYTGVTIDSIQQTMASGDSSARERVNNAFMTAWSTLGNHTFNDSSSITMDELLPTGPDGSNLLLLQPIKVRFDAFATDFAVYKNGVYVDFGKEVGEPVTCRPYLSPLTVKSPVEVGVYKDPKVLTYYAIRLQAKANLLFSPWGAITLRAYASAQPFGSRIGPKLEANDWSYAASDAPACNTGSSPCAGRVPNLPVTQEDPSAARTSGWSKKGVIASFYSKFQKQGEEGTLGAIDGDALNRAYQAAAVPNYFERGKYNMINDLFPTDPMIQNFDTNIPAKEKRLHAIWAPLISKDLVADGGTPVEVLKKRTQEFFAEDPANPSDAGATPAQTQSLFEAAASNYVSLLDQGKGEDGEGYNVVRVEDPFMTYPDQSGQPPQLINLPNPKIMLKEASEVRSSWSAAKDGTIKAAGRTGYSVKFVPLNLLREPAGVTSNGSEVWTNVLPVDAIGEDDIPKIQH